MGSEPHPDPEKWGEYMQPAQRKAASKAARLATMSRRECDIQVSQLQSPWSLPIEDN